jgi:uncharacterized protein DUF1553/uncharacterized protein DUF1549/cytochrome c
VVQKPVAYRMKGCVPIIVLLAGSFLHAQEPRAGADYFEREVRPILADACFKCHGAAKQESDLRLDSRERMLQGGVLGPAVVPGESEKSLLIAAIRHEGDLKMPPQARLTEAQIAAVMHWVRMGAPWPVETAAPTNVEDAARMHWAFQPVRDPPVPQVEGNNSPNPIDAFIRANLAEAGLTGSPPADRRTLARRVSFGLTGLPLATENVDAFECDSDPQAYERLVERLLAQPQYGEHWGRHWLDVARYSDTKGYVYAREQRVWVHAWTYRDWVVQALNDDMPYDRFLLLQIAADQAAPDDGKSLAAMGFLTLGRRFLGVSREIIDDRIDVLARGTMGLTVACARCHDHKYDPIPTRDYYSLYGIFQSCSEHLVAIRENASRDEKNQRYMAELTRRREKLAETMVARRLETADRNRARAGDYLAAQLELHKYPPEGFDQVLAKTDLLPTFVHGWRDYLEIAQERADPVFVPWHAYATLSPREFAAKSRAITQRLVAQPPGQVNSLLTQHFSNPPASMAEVARRYGDALAKVNQQWQCELQAAAREQRPPPIALSNDAAEALRQVLYSAGGPCEVPDEPIVNIEYFFDSATCNELWNLQNQVENWILQSPQAPRYALVLQDRDRPTTPHVFRRGNPANLGDRVPRQFVSVLAGPGRQPFSSGSGRLELAQAIIDPKNPLTARVLVNRVWAHHFGAGLVRTLSDFGRRADPPSHPELLDWLTRRFIEDGWSLKQLHRRILLSETYRRSSRGPVNQAARDKANQLDPENRMLWRMNEHRLSFEEMRDSLLTAAGQLDRTVGGRAGDLLSPQFTRRTLYGRVDRQFLPTALRVFDFANPDLHIPVRSETTVPQQALFFLNHPLLIGYARALAARTAGAASDEQRIEQMYRLTFQRSARQNEARSALEFVQHVSGDNASEDRSPNALTWQYGYGAFDQPSQRITGFEKLPHFTGSAWQGGASYPDNKLGWLQLTAAGGHPGNDLAHAVIRRWTAPRDMQVTVKSTLIHEPKEGEGVRGFVVNGRSGLLGRATVHHGQAALNVSTISVQAGDTLDFVADIGNQLSYNQFLWKAVISSAEPSMVFDSERDFAGPSVQHLGPWEQLAQVLLASNEFLFVD